MILELFGNILEGLYAMGHYMTLISGLMVIRSLWLMVPALYWIFSKFFYATCETCQFSGCKSYYSPPSQSHVSIQRIHHELPESIIL